jgi:rod shape-determining protein MreD
MKLSLLFLFLGFIMVLLQTTVLHLLPLGPIVPDLTLVLCVYWALNRPTVGAVLGSFILGYSVDVLSSPVLGINALAMSLVFLIAYLSSRFILIVNPLLSAAVVFVASLLKAGTLVVALSVFVSAGDRPAGILRYIFLEALCAAVFAPVLFLLLRRGQSHLEKVRPGSR